MKHLFPAALLLRLDNLLDNLSFLYQECSKDPRIWIENHGSDRNTVRSYLVFTQSPHLEPP